MANNVTVNLTQHVATIDPLGVGFVVSEFGGNPIPLVGDTTWKSNLASLAPGHVRCSVAYYGGNPGYGAGGSSRTPGTATAMINTIKGIGAIPLVSYNGDNSDNGINASDGGNLVHYFNDNSGQHGGPIQYWSIGNEPDNGGGSGAYEGIVNGIANAMWNASNGINIGAPAAAYWDTSLISNIASNVTRLGCLSYHAYDGGNTDGTGFPTDGQLYTHVHSDLPGYKAGILYGVEEMNWNPSYTGQTQWYDWHNCNFIADNCGQALSAGGHATVYSDYGTALGLMNDGTGANNQPGAKYTRFPAYWGLGIWTGMNGQFKRWGTYMVTATTTFARSTLTAYASDNGKIVLCNNSGSNQALSIGLTLAAGATSGTYNVWATSAGSPTSAITKVVSAAAFSGSTITYTIPAQTVVSIDVTASSGGSNTVTVTNPGSQTSTAGTAITALQMTATDSAAGQTFTWAASGLPTGLSIGSSNGQITGTPSAAGTYTATVTATDTTSAAGSISFTWTVNAASGNTVTVTNPGSQTGVVSTAITALQIRATDSANGQTLTYSASGLPAGLSIASGTGLITGTPTTAATYNVTVTATDTTSASGTASFTWTISPAGGPGTTLTLVNDFRQGTAGTGITTGNSAGAGENAFDAVTTTNSATAVYSTAQAIHSPLSAAFATTAVAGVSYVTWSTSLGAQTTVYGRVYLYMSANPASTDTIVNFFNGASYGGGILLTSGGVLQTQSAGSVSAGTQVIPTGQWVRLEWKVVAGAAGTGSLTINYYASADSATITSTTADTTNAYGSSASINTVNFGWTNSHASQPVMYQGNLNVNLQGYPGPASSAVVLVNNMESGITGTTVSPANSGSSTANAFDGVTILASQPVHAPTYAQGQGARLGDGIGIYAFTGAAAGFLGPCNVYWSTSLGQQSTVYGRAYIRMQAWPSADDTVIQFTSAGTFGGGIMITAAGALGIQSAAFAEFFGGITVPVSSYFRVEWKVTCGAAGSASCTVNYYSSLDSVTPAATVTDTTGQYGANGFINQVAFGWNTAHASQPVMYMDDLGLSTTGYMGPAGHPATGSVALSPPVFPTTGNTATDTIALLYNLFEGGTNLTTITTANSGGASGNAFDIANVTNGTLQYTTTHPAHGNFAGLFSTTSAGGVAWVGWNTSFVPTTTFYGRVNIYLTANPASTDAVFQHKGSLSTSAGNIQINTAGQLVGQTPSFAQAFVFTNSVVLNQWFRVEWFLKAGAAGTGILTVNYYSSVDSTIITESHTDQTFAWGGTNGVAEIGFGWTNTHPSQPSMYLDDFDVNTTSFLGPAGITASGAVSLQPLALSGTAADAGSKSATGGPALQPMVLSGRAGTNAQPQVTNIVSGNIINDYGLDNIFYTVSTTGPTTGLVAFIGWDLAQSTVATSGRGPAVNVTDSAGNLWRQTAITPVTGTSRAAIWFCSRPRQVSWISVAVTGWAFSTSYTIAEVDNIPTSLGAVSLDFVQTAHQDTAVTALTVPTGTATAADLCFGILSTGGNGGPLTVPTGWSGIFAVGGGLSNQAVTYSMYIPNKSAGSVSFIPTWNTAQPASGAIVGLKLTAPAPVQSNPNFPNVVVEAAFGATPGDWTQSVDYTWDISGLTWTDISTRVIGDGTQGRIRVTRGRQYELSQEETGEIQITLDNHDGIFTYGNTASPYYPNVVPGVPVRVTAWFNGTQYPVAFGYVERWPQEWPELPQWGFSTVIAVDAYGPLASTTMPSAVEGEIRKDSPYAYFPNDEQYSFTTQSLDPVKVPVDANGFIAVNKAFGNSRFGAYRDGTSQPVTTGQALNLLGDGDTVMGASNYIAPEVNASGPGMFYFDPNIPANNKGVTFEFWFTWGGGPLAASTLFNAWAGPSSFYRATSPATAGGVLSIGVNTGSKGTKATGFFVNGINISPSFSQASLSPQHFVLASGPQYAFNTGTPATTTYLNNVNNALGSAIPSFSSIRAVTLGPARFSYDVSDLCVYNGYNFTAGHLAIYPYELTPQQITNHYVAGIYGASYIPAPGRFAQVLTWGLLALKRGGTAWYGAYGNAENTFMSEAYSYEGSTGADIMSQLTQTEGGRCFVQANGSLVYVMRWNRYNQPARATFGDNGTTELPFLKDSSFSVDNSFIYNQVSAVQNRGPNQTVFYQATDTASQYSYFNRSGLQIQSYALTPFDVFDAVNWSMAKYRQPLQRVQVLSLDVAASQGKFPSMFPTVLGLELNQIVTVNRRPVGGAVISVAGGIQEIQHDIGPNVWTTRYQIAPAAPENQALIADVSGQNTPGTQSLSW